MNQSTLRNILSRAENWADEEREELADYARVIEARREGVYRLNASEREAVSRGLEQADRGEFVEIAAAPNPREG